MNQLDNTAGIDELKRELRDYWKAWEDPNKKAVELLKGEYVDRLLEKIMGQVQRPEGTCTVLAMCVGLSWEPLVQTICAYQPDFLAAIFNQNYRSLKREGRGYEPKSKGEMKKDFQEIVRHLHGTGWTGRQLVEEDHIQLLDIPDDTPANVFKVLRDGLDQFRQVPGFPEDAKIVVDITGARKSMIAGAFLYAAYGGQSISYVDQDETRFDDETGRMFDFYTRIAELPNPYELFRLREWEAVRDLYHRNNFTSAQRTLRAVVAAMRELVQEGYFTDKQVGSAELLGDILECYHEWDSGNLRSAWEKAGQIKAECPGFSPPAAITILGPEWPVGETPGELTRAYNKLQYGDPGQPKTSIFLNQQKITVYAKDELLRIKRLIDTYEDPRSGLLRAASLSEFLLKARLAALWQKQVLREDPMGNRAKNWSAEFRHSLVFGALVQYDSARNVTKYLADPCQPLVLQKFIEILPDGDPREHSGEVQVRIDPDECNVSLAPLTAGNGLDLVKLADLRNDAIHFCLQVDPDLAKDAYSLVEASWEEYRDQWAPLLDAEEPTEAEDTFDIEQMKWSGLYTLCALDFLPHHLRQDKEKS